MIATVLSVVLLLFALLKYNSGRYAWPLFILIFFASNAFLVNLGDPILKYKDFGLLMLVGCCCLGLKRDSSFFKFKGIPGAKISVCFLAFFALEFLYAYLNNIDTIGNVLAVSRDYLYALTYFVFRKAPTNDSRKGCTLIFKGVMVACALFVTQFFTHIELTQSYISEGNLSIGNYRMQSTPPFLALILMTLLFYMRRIKGRWLFIILLFGVYLISQNRTPLIALFLEIGLFILFARKTKHKIPIMIAAMIAFPFVNSLLASRASEEGNTSNFDVPVLSYITQGNFKGLAMQSTFMFRIALIAERADYIMSKPEYLLLGVGPMHEDTAQKKFNFSVGTGGIDSNGQVYIGQLNSIDVVWGPLIIRYGLVGFALHLTIIIWMIVAFYKKRDNPIMMLGFLTYIAALAQSFSSGGLFLLLGITTIMGFLIAYDRQLELVKN